MPTNNLSHLDEEFIFKIRPIDFEKLSDYVSIVNAQAALLKLNINTQVNAMESNIYEHIKPIPVLTATQIEDFINDVSIGIKKS